tara:strand:- start:64 stop:393 length:330 start_codon:yes stop_codon:yes gene_type:complete
MENVGLLIVILMIIGLTAFLGYFLGRLGGKPKKYKLIKEALKEITGEPGKLFEFCDKHKDDEDLMDIYEDINAYLETDMGKWVGKIQGKIEIKDTVDISCNGLNEGGDI